MNSNKSVPAKDTFDISWIQKEARCWVYLPNENQNDIYLKGTINGIVPLSINKANSNVMVALQNGSTRQIKAFQLQKRRDSNKLQRDLIQMDTINAPQVLLQLKRRLAEFKIHTCLWNSLIIVNPFKLIPDLYTQKTLANYFQHIFALGQDIRKHEPHIFSFMFQILEGIHSTEKTQVISISGQSGSGKTEANKQALKAISYCCQRVQSLNSSKGKTNMETKVLKCDPILQVFGNAKTIKNDNSSRFGKLITLRINGESMKIYHSSIKDYFLQKSRIISQSPGERNFHIFYQFITFISEEQRSQFRLKSHLGHPYRTDDFRYLTQKDKHVLSNDRTMWDTLLQSFNSLDFGKDIINQIWSIVAAILLLGNVDFDSSTLTEIQPCDIKNIQLIDSISLLLGMDRKELLQSLVVHHRKIAKQDYFSPLTEKQCREGRDSMAKAIYQSLFQWIVEQLNRKLNLVQPNEQHVRVLKLLDIYGFEVFDNNSFQQLCVNYTNEKIHQIYLEQVFIHEKGILRKEGLEAIIPKLTFTDNIKIIDLLDTTNKSVFNLLDESCAVNVKDEDFLANVRKHHDQHEHFPPINSNNTRRSFIIKHTPGDIQYMAEGFRDKNKDLIREDIVAKITVSKLKILRDTFKERAETLKVETNQRFLGVKIRKQVRELIQQMSINTDLHFIRCIKPNESKQPFQFIDRICYNQIKYLGILDTIQMRRDSYHIRNHYSQFYQKYGILQGKVEFLVGMSEGRLAAAQCKEITQQFVSNQQLRYNNLEYIFGKERIFMKMDTQYVFDKMLKNKLKYINPAASLIKAHYRRSHMNKRRAEIKNGTRKIQRAVRIFLANARKIKKKRAVRTIENGWIKFHETYFALKKRKHIIPFQKYLKARIAESYIAEKVKAIARAKFLLRSLAESNRLIKDIQNFKEVKSLLLAGLYDSVWQKMRQRYIGIIHRSLKGSKVIRDNSRAIAKAEQDTLYRLNIKYRKYLQKCLHGHLQHHRFQQKKHAILYIQSWYRMLKLRRKYKDLRKLTVMIQRNWRKYYYDKQFNLRYTPDYFNNQGGDEGISQQNQYWRQFLFRDYGKSSRNRQFGVEKVLWGNERIKMDKIGLFYYLLDFQVLTPLASIYPQHSWIDNYNTLFEQSWAKGNPIQVVDVSDEHTVCCTINKIYTWGNYTLNDLVDDQPSRWTTIQSLNLPTTQRIEKVSAHNGFTFVQMENGEPLVVGDQRLYQEDCSNREWKTLNDSFVIINGVLLTLRNAKFTRLAISDKVVQLSCGMEHCIAKTSLRKVFTWGDNSRGQLGHGNYIRIQKPKIMDLFIKNAISVQQVAASAYGSLALDSNSRIWWWGSNSTVSNRALPQECLLYEKSEFIDNTQKYIPVKIITSWSKSLSIIGVTMTTHEGIFTSAQNNIRRKIYQNLINKWNQDINTITPPFVQAISGYFQEKLMPKTKMQEPGRNKETQNQRIRQRLLAEIMLMEQAERTLLRQKNKY